MKSAAALPAFLSLVVAGLGGATLFVGCGGDDPAPVAEDTGTPVTDTGVIDTGKPDTIKTDTPPPSLSCMAPLPTGFECKAPTAKAGKTVCTDAMIEEFSNCFGTSGSSAKCTAAQKAYPQCNTCILKDWLDNNSIDTAACIAKIDPASTCGKTVKCNSDCLDAVCPADDCDTTEGSGVKGGTSTQRGDCYADAQAKGGTVKPKGVCYDLATKDYGACATDPKFTFCFVSSIADITTFFRGACRDNGDWSKADVPMPTDAGTDAPATETATDAATDAASDAPADGG